MKAILTKLATRVGTFGAGAIATYVTLSDAQVLQIEAILTAIFLVLTDLYTSDQQDRHSARKGK